MDENKEIPKNNIGTDVRNAIHDQLASYMNPKAEKISSEEPVSGADAETAGEHEKKDGPRPIIRTYKSDVEETIQAEHLSSINMAVIKNNKLMKQGGQDAAEEIKKPRINKNIFIIATVLLVLAALVILVPNLLIQKENTANTQPVSALSSQNIITTDAEEKINVDTLDPDTADIALKEQVDQSATTLGQVKDFLLTEGDGAAEKPITSSEFLSLIKADVPPDLALTLKPEYMFGMYNFNGNQEFVILTVGSYDTTFSGMLSWEPDLWQNFKNLFGLTDTPSNSTDTAVSASSSSATSSTDTNAFGIEVKQFQDATFDNKDARVVKDATGKIIFLYSIIDNNTVVITTSTDTLEEIITRISEAKAATQ